MGRYEIYILAFDVKKGNFFDYVGKEMGIDKSIFNNKVCYLFGCGVGADIFLEEFHDACQIEGIFDNSEKKIGKSVSYFLYSYNQSAIKQRDILDFKSSSLRLTDDSLIIITSLKYAAEIKKQIHEICTCKTIILEELFGRNLLPEVKKYRNRMREAYYKLPVCGNKILVHSMGLYIGHGKAIIEKILHKRDSLDIALLVKDTNIQVPDGVRLIDQNNLLEYQVELATAHIWIEDYMLPAFANKKKNQIAIETKHWSSITLKEFGIPLLRFRKEDLAIEGVKNTGKLLDYIFVGSDFDRNTCAEGFAFDKEFVFIGSPRSDVLFHSDSIKEKICNKYQIGAKKIVLYAPTFRIDDSRKDVYKYEQFKEELEIDTLLTTLKEKFGETFVFLLRLHPNIAYMSKELFHHDSCIDVSAYPDSQELVAASDIVITDYSSIMFEPAFVKKPVFLYAPDRTDYINGERGLLIEYDSLPFPIAETNEELKQNIIDFDYEKYVTDVDVFLDAYGVHEDGHASERAADFILKLIDNNSELGNE